MEVVFHCLQVLDWHPPRAVFQAPSGQLLQLSPQLEHLRKAVVSDPAPTLWFPLNQQRQQLQLPQDKASERSLTKVSQALTKASDAQRARNDEPVVKVALSHHNFPNCIITISVLNGCFAAFSGKWLQLRAHDAVDLGSNPANSHVTRAQNLTTAASWKQSIWQIH